LPQRLTREGKQIKAMEMFGNKSIRDISKISAKIFFGVDESLKFAARVGLSFGNKKNRPDFK